MPNPANPNKCEFYVYRIMLGSVVFYVGHGRDRRDTDRIRYVKRQIERKRQGLPVHWHLSIEVLAKLIEEGFEDQVRIRRAPEGITKRQAKIAERLLIDRLIGRGTVLSNEQHNPHRDLPAHIIAKIIINAQPGDA